eukprot:6206880-Pleurochrysis_carterae.AAC.3
MADKLQYSMTRRRGKVHYAPHVLNSIRLGFHYRYCAMLRRRDKFARAKDHVCESSVSRHPWGASPDGV